tara:strand:+ start:505 stop:792 length:288 start_codon:yes stop_codon:yes gene_type:complete
VAKQKSILKFWIPFAGSNPSKCGTQIEVVPGEEMYSVTPFPATRRRADMLVRNGRTGLMAIRDAIAQQCSPKVAEQLFLNVCGELLLGHQRHARR